MSIAINLLYNILYLYPNYYDMTKIAVQTLEEITEFHENKHYITIRTQNQAIQSVLRQNLGMLSNHFHHVIFTFQGKEEDLKSIGNIIRVDLDSIHADLHQILESKEYDNTIKVIANMLEESFSPHAKDIDLIGFQRHLIDHASLTKIDSESFGSASLGLLKNGLDELEPSLRTSEKVFLDLNVLRNIDTLGAIKDAQPVGLNNENLCQIARYIGTSKKLKTVSFLNLSNVYPGYLDHLTSIISLLLWYIAEGIESTYRAAIEPEAYSEFFVQIRDIEEHLVFLLGQHDGKWWVKVDNTSNVIPCSKNDYESAVKGNISEKLFRRLFIQ